MAHELSLFWQKTDSCVDGVRSCGAKSVPMAQEFNIVPQEFIPVAQHSFPAREQFLEALLLWHRGQLMNYCGNGINSGGAKINSCGTRIDSWCGWPGPLGYSNNFGTCLKSF